jgi:CPA1 family monovalent cation:H+ antiporter
VAGFAVQQSALKANYLTRMQEKSLWISIDTVFETFVFAFIGLHVRFIVESIHTSNLNTEHAILLGFGVLALVISLRFIFVKAYTAILIFYHKVNLNNYERMKKRAADSNFDQNNINTQRLTSSFYKNSITASQKYIHNLSLRKKESTIIGWTGMRGVVTLATAFSVPAVLENGTPLVGRPIIQLTALIVTVGTLLIQGLTLPILIKKTIPEDVRKVPHNKDYRKALKVMNNSAMETISKLDFRDKKEQRQRKILRALHSIQNQQTGLNQTEESITQLLEDVVEKQREDLLYAVEVCEITQETADELLQRLDLRQALYSST